MHSYVAIDVETANRDRSSICQIGLVVVRKGMVATEQSILVNPQADFDDGNIAIHGILPADVIDAPIFSDIAQRIIPAIAPFPIIHHTSFDRTAINGACAEAGLEEFKLNWLDSSMAVRHVWPQFKNKGYGLANLCKHFEITMRNHHDALSDAKAAQEIFEKVLLKTGASPNEIIKLIAASPSQQAVAKETFEPKAGAEYLGQTIVFTGSTETPRQALKRRASELGFTVKSRVTMKTTHLVDNNAENSEPTGKLKRAFELIESGQEILILNEAEFLKFKAR